MQRLKPLVDQMVLEVVAKIKAMVVQVQQDKAMLAETQTTITLAEVAEVLEKLEPTVHI
jgi:4-hydroxy-3-methylbut-2-enyl diphosphate reductase IspH